jgi:hypothetical protein
MRTRTIFHRLLTPGRLIFHESKRNATASQSRDPLPQQSVPIRSAWPSGVKKSAGWAGSHGRKASKSRTRCAAIGTASVGAFARDRGTQDRERMSRPAADGSAAGQGHAGSAVSGPGVSERKLWPSSGPRPK